MENKIICEVCGKEDYVIGSNQYCDRCMKIYNDLKIRGYDVTLSEIRTAYLVMCDKQDEGDEEKRRCLICGSIDLISEIGYCYDCVIGYLDDRIVITDQQAIDKIRDRLDNIDGIEDYILKRKVEYTNGNYKIDYGGIVINMNRYEIEKINQIKNRKIDSIDDDNIVKDIGE